MLMPWVEDEPIEPVFWSLTCSFEKRLIAFVDFFFASTLQFRLLHESQGEQNSLIQQVTLLMREQEKVIFV